MLDMPIRSERSFDALDSRVLGFAALTLAAIGTGVAGSIVADSRPVDGPWSLILGVLLVIAAGAPLVLRLRTNRLDGPGLYALVTVLFFGVDVAGMAWQSHWTPARPGPGRRRLRPCIRRRRAGDVRRRGSPGCGTGPPASASSFPPASPQQVGA